MVMSICKFKLLLKSVLVFLIVGIVFVGCRPTLQAKYIGTADSIKNREYYMLEVEKLMTKKGYNKTDRGSNVFQHYGVDNMDVYELNNNTLLVFGTSWYDGKEKFFVDVYTVTNELFDKSQIYLSLVSELIDIVSGYDISEGHLNDFCDAIEYDNDKEYYINETYLDYYNYYKLHYSILHGGIGIPDFFGTYSVYFSFSGLTKTGLETQE